LFSQTSSRLRLSIQEGTGSVPHDHRYYVTERDRIVGAFDSLAEARRSFSILHALRSVVPIAVGLPE
jgi:hypothetical protein